MKRISLYVRTAFLALSLGAIAQGQGGPGPHAWGDKNKDGKCDITGQPVGQGRSQRMASMRQAGQCCGRCQQGACCRTGQCPPAQTTPSPEAKPEAKK
jgi:hypothetical protein